MVICKRQCLLCAYYNFIRLTDGLSEVGRPFLRYVLNVHEYKKRNILKSQKNVDNLMKQGYNSEDLGI